MKDLTLAIRKRILAIILIAALIIAQALFITPLCAKNQVYAGDASLEVRVQYEGWREDKIPVKASFTRTQLESIGNQVYKYANVTDVATLLRIVARGPRVVDVIEAAGIDRNSIKYIVFRTTDGSGKDRRFSMQLEPWEYETERFYYPNLAKNYERDNEECIIYPNKGSLSGAIKVPAILGLSYYCTKTDQREISESKMVKEDLLRLCIGQTTLQEEQWSDYGYSGDVTSHESVQSIFGMDVVLKGSPISGMNLAIDQLDLKVGSSAKVSVSVSGDEAFASDYKASQMKWSSSDKSVATVDKNGTVTIVGPGSATITATAPDGTQASIVINGTGTKKDEKAVGDKADTEDRKKSINKEKIKIISSITAKELVLGDKIEATTDDSQNVDVNPEVQALGEAENYSKGALAGTIGGVIAACGAGFVLRIRKYRIDK